jgi:hypothetical protein
LTRRSIRFGFFLNNNNNNNKKENGNEHKEKGGGGSGLKKKSNWLIGEVRTFYFFLDFLLSSTKDGIYGKVALFV